MTVQTQGLPFDDRAHTPYTHRIRIGHEQV
jgi:hypothetical protein